MTAGERRRPPSTAREAKLTALQQKATGAPIKAPAAAVAVEPPSQPVYEANYAPAPPIELEPPVEVMTRASEAEAIVEKMRTALKKRTADVDGHSGIQGLARNFRICDRNNNRRLDLEEFAKCIALCKVEVTAEEVAAVHRHFDRDGSGAIDFDEFLHAVRGRLAPSRRKLVVQAFYGLDAMGNGDGVLTVADLAPLYDTSKHPDVAAGRIDAATALRTFLDGFEGSQGDRDGTVSLEEWIAYYEGVSASIDNDDHFNQLMATTWGHLKAPGSSKKPAISYVSSRDIDTLEKLLFEATYRRKGGSMHSQERLLNDAFKLFDADGSGQIEPKEFLKAMERFGLHVRGKGRPGIGGLPEDVVLGLFSRYDKDGSGALSFREFSQAFVSRNQLSGGSTIPADEYKNPPASARAAEGGDDSHLRHPRKARDPELMGVRTSQVVNRGYLSNATRVHGSKSGNKGPASGAPFKLGR